MVGRRSQRVSFYLHAKQPPVWQPTSMPSPSLREGEATQPYGVIAGQRVLKLRPNRVTVAPQA